MGKCSSCGRRLLQHRQHATAHLMISSTRSTISAASVADSSTACLTCGAMQAPLLRDGHQGAGMAHMHQSGLLRSTFQDPPQLDAVARFPPTKHVVASFLWLLWPQQHSTTIWSKTPP